VPCSIPGSHSVQSIKHVNIMIFLPKLTSESVTHQVSHTKTHQLSHTKTLEIVCWFYIYLMCFLWRNKLLFIHSLTRNIFSITVVLLKMSKLIRPKFWDFAQIFDKSNFHEGACTPVPTALPVDTLGNLLMLVTDLRVPFKATAPPTSVVARWMAPFW